MIMVHWYTILAERIVEPGQQPKFQCSLRSQGRLIGVSLEGMDDSLNVSNYLLSR